MNVVMQQVNVMKLREDLQDTAQLTLYITYKDFVARAKATGAAPTDAAAESLCAAMQRSGLVLRHHNLVYLRADEITDMVMMMLPGGREDAAANLKAVEGELAEMERVHNAVEARANRTTNVILVCGAIVLFAQLIGFIYLTWWELSWDVMEPFGYIIQLFYSFLAYIYFLSTKGAVFDLGPFRAFWSERFRKQGMSSVKFDQERYAQLKRVQQRYLRHTSHAAFRV
ncbi:hypothetical protein FOA52_000701 [Chlamydomonas sp. UWO 241]|nr:hypothetical protein FOA52_000701 [Chlamydomonas sp. UWO 241]